MRIEDVVAHWIVQGRNEIEKSQAQVGSELTDYLGRPWSRQAVSAAEKGRRSFTAAELVALAMVLGCTVEKLLEPPEGVDSVELGDGQSVDARHLRTTTATNQDLAALAKAVQELRNRMPDVRDEVKGLDDLVRTIARETWKATRGRGIEVAEEERRGSREALPAGIVPPVRTGGDTR